MCSKMERCKESEIVAERFKASARRINQNLADAIVSVQTGCRAYQVEQAVSDIRERAGLSTERNTWTRTITVMTNGINGDGALQAWIQAL